jgi:histone-lysine N-methyltransferase ASH1L
MIKWIVSGQPRMALFAGDRPIMTGEELTYDYNFAPYSKDPQKCLCGADNCRGVLGPKPRDVKVPKAVVAPKDEPIKKSTLKTAIKAGKRKLQELLGQEEDVYDDIEGASTKTNKKRKTSTATAASSLTKGSLQVAKGAAKAVKRSVSSVSLSAKAALTSKASVSSLRETPSTMASRSDARKSAPARATVSEKKVITSSRAAVAVALAAAGIAPSKKAANRVAKASGNGSGAKTIVAKAKTPKGLSTGNGNAKTKSKPALKVKTTPPKIAKSSPQASKKHSGYTPPSSPKGGSAKQALFISSRKKTPTRKVLESAKAGTASVTKPKATPQARAKTKLVKKLSTIVKKQRDIASMLKVAESETPTGASSSAAKKGKGKKVPGQASPADPSPVTAKSGIRAVAASPAGKKGRPRTPAGSNLDVVSSSPLSALSSVRSTPKMSPKSPPESASQRAPRILLIRRDLTVDDSSN